MNQKNEIPVIIFAFIRANFFNQNSSYTMGS